jgi:hypothetical protein
MLALELEGVLSDQAQEVRQENLYMAGLSICAGDYADT